ncbi:hypothetical protein C8J56DRAFT_900767 [Mycena floridula]|nr:hypothetical protein C8J56DRAFT_900767 [Mycena floridula]
MANWQVLAASLDKAFQKANMSGSNQEKDQPHWKKSKKKSFENTLSVESASHEISIDDTDSSTRCEESVLTLAMKDRKRVRDDESELDIESGREAKKRQLGRERSAVMGQSMSSPMETDSNLLSAAPITFTHFHTRRSHRRSSLARRSPTRSLLARRSSPSKHSRTKIKTSCLPSIPHHGTPFPEKAFFEPNTLTFSRTKTTSVSPGPTWETYRTDSPSQDTDSDEEDSTRDIDDATRGTDEELDELDSSPLSRFSRGRDAHGTWRNIRHQPGGKSARQVGTVKSLTQVSGSRNPNQHSLFSPAPLHRERGLSSLGAKCRGREESKLLAIGEPKLCATVLPKPTKSPKQVHWLSDLLLTHEFVFSILHTTIVPEQQAALEISQLSKSEFKKMGKKGSVLVLVGDGRYPLRRRVVEAIFGGWNEQDQCSELKEKPRDFDARTGTFESLSGSGSMGSASRPLSAESGLHSVSTDPVSHPVPADSVSQSGPSVCRLEGINAEHFAVLVRYVKGRIHATKKGRQSAGMDLLSIMQILHSSRVLGSQFCLPYVEEMLLDAGRFGSGAQVEAALEAEWDDFVQPLQGLVTRRELELELKSFKQGPKPAMQSSGPIPGILFDGSMNVNRR